MNNLNEFKTKYIYDIHFTFSDIICELFPFGEKNIIHISEQKKGRLHPNNSDRDMLSVKYRRFCKTRRSISNF